MYNEYDVVYKSDINEYLIYWIILGVLALSCLIITLISLSKIFKKSNFSPLSAWIPFYNLKTVIDIVNLPFIYFILSLIPILNIYIFYKISNLMAKMFKKSEMFGLGLFLLPFVFYPILAFGKSEYIGINLVAMESKNMVEEIPLIDENKNKEIEVEVNDREDIWSQGVGISIGGGTYQKEYSDNLVAVDSDKVVDHTVQDVAERKTKGIFLNKDLIDAQTKQEENNNPVNNLLSTNSNNINEVENPKQNAIALNMPEEIKKGEDIVEKEIKPNPAVPKPLTANPAVPTPVEPPKIEVINNENSTQTIGGIPNTNKENMLPRKSPIKSDGSYKLCPNCGTKLQDGVAVCFICGQHL